MRFLTKADAKQEEAHNTSKKKNKSEEIKKKEAFVKFAKAAKFESGQLFSKGAFPPHFNHGA